MWLSPLLSPSCRVRLCSAWPFRPPLFLDFYDLGSAGVSPSARQFTPNDLCTKISFLGEERERERESERERNSQFGTHKTLPGLGGTLHGTLSKLQSWRQGGTGHGSHGSRQGALTTLPFRSGGSHPHSRLETQMPDAATILHREFIRVQHQHLASLGTVHI